MADASVDWLSYEAIRRDALWSSALRKMKTSGLVRSLAAMTWIALVFVTSSRRSSGLWGVTMLAGGLLAIVHASRATVVRVNEVLLESRPALARAWMRLFPYPDQPSLNPSGLLEGVGLVLIGVGTSRWAGVFAGDPLAWGVATVLVFVIVASFVRNLTGHLTWELSSGPWVLRLVRPILSVGIAAIAVVVLWPDSTLRSAVFVVAVCAAAAAMAGWEAQLGLAAEVRRLDIVLGSARIAVQDADAALVHSALKNPSRAILDDCGRISDPEQRDAIRRLCYSITGMERQLRQGQSRPARSAVEIVEALTSSNARWHRFRGCVEADLESTTLNERDGALTFLVISDLLTNALVTDPPRVSVRLASESSPDGSIVTAEVGCWCGRQLTEITPGSSLLRLAARVRSENGSLSAEQRPDGSHVFVARWPTDGHPVAARGNVGQ